MDIRTTSETQAFINGVEISVDTIYGDLSIEFPYYLYMEKPNGEYCFGSILYKDGESEKVLAEYIETLKKGNPISLRDFEAKRHKSELAEKGDERRSNKRAYLNQ